MSAWKSRWSWVRLVNAPTANRIPSTRLRASACEETSIAQASIARLDHAPEGRLQVDRLGRRALDRLLDAADDPLHGPEQPGLDPGALEDVADQERRRRLPVRPGDADDPQLVGRLAAKARRRVCHRGAGVAHDRLGDERLELEPALDHDRSRAGLDGVGRELVAVGGEPGDAEEEDARARLTTVVGEACDVGVGIADDLDHVGPGEQLAKLHRGRF